MAISKKHLIQAMTLTSLSLGTVSGQAWWWDDDTTKETDQRGKLDYDSSVRVVDLAPNVERTEPTANASDLPPFRISVDDQTVVAKPASGQRETDLALDEMRINITFDSLSQERYLNATPDEVTAIRGEPILIRTFSNYDEWISRRELRIFLAGHSSEAKPDWILPVNTAGIVQWTPDAQTSDKVHYVLRVYDEQGRFDDTSALPLRVRDLREADENPDEDRSLKGYGVNHIARRNIPVSGGVVTANGFSVPDGYRVSFMGSPVPLNENRNFVAQQILKTGNHDVSVLVEDEKGHQVSFDRNLYLPKDDWFYVALADLTIGENNVEKGDPATFLNDNQHFNDDVYTDGRGAFYVKGRIKGEYLLTAAADTGEQDTSDLFKALRDRDPRELFRQIKSDEYYTVYGDDSVTQQDAATQGRLYVKLERGESYVLWGNFRTQINGTDFAQLSRGVYGLQGHWVSDESTAFGERRTVVDGFAAQPETRSSREEFRGTGGSLYYLHRRDITKGSERVSVQVRDKDSGIVISNTELNPNQDYHLDPFSGRILLNEPLASVTDDKVSLVRADVLDGHPMYLVVRYEYNPVATDITDDSVGGRATHWITDNVQVGVTGGHERQLEREQDIAGIDATYRHSAGTYVRTEIAQSKGPGKGELASTDGGFVFSDIEPNYTQNIKAGAARIEGHIDFRDFGYETGDIQVYIQKREDGFSGEGQRTLEAITQAGLAFDSELDDLTRFNFKVDTTERENNGGNTAVSANVTRTLNENWDIGVGLRGSDRDSNATDTTASSREDGQRLDLAVQLDYTGGKNWSAYGFAQGTVEREAGRAKNDRVGIGGDWQVNNRLTLDGEVSGGDRTVGTRIGATFQKDDKTEVYTNYQLTTDRTDDGENLINDTLVTGTRTRYTDALHVFSERRASRADQDKSLTNVYGASYAPTDEWTFGASLEKGELHGNSGDTQRNAVALSAGYTKEKTKWAGALEWRRDEQTTEDRTTWLLRTNINHQTAPDWRALGKLDVSTSTTTAGANGTAKFADFSAGMAYRPIDNDEFNGLFKYTYYYDLPTATQLSASGITQNYAQKSHILSADFIYDVTEKLSLGAKLGIRKSELRADRIGAENWFSSTVGLGIVRADYHVVRNWDLFGELRGLRSTLADDSRSGFLLGGYRHIGDTMKVGLGYNFTDFSDDLTRLDYKYDGWFLNLIGKY
ncbi:MAG: OmpA family protein [Gammaproteobacteria bacterium]|nr:OmpA family protein [Gammaproteobacteria bacterium]MCP5136808.1 OmpA family protein [Gammaproteobacteria bacterium]